MKKDDIERLKWNPTGFELEWSKYKTVPENMTVYKATGSINESQCIIEEIQEHSGNDISTWLLIYIHHGKVLFYQIQYSLEHSKRLLAMLDDHFRRVTSDQYVEKLISNDAVDQKEQSSKVNTRTQHADDELSAISDRIDKLESTHKRISDVIEILERVATRIELL